MSEPGALFHACKYTPCELLAGFGAEGVLAEADVASFDEADRLAHPNLCGYGKGLLERLTRDDVREVVLVSCCDVVKRVYDVLKAQGRPGFLYLLDLPHRRGEAELALWKARLRDLAEAYGRHVGRGFDPSRALAALRALPDPDGPHVDLVGAHASAGLVGTVEEGVGLPVRNRTCTSERFLGQVPAGLERRLCAAPATGCPAAGGEAGAPCADARPEPPDPLGEFLDWYADALLNQMPCMRMDDVARRAQLVEALGDRLGIVYHTMKFCDYYGFEHSSLVGSVGVPLVKVETDGTSQSAGQLRTRLEAFGETLPVPAGAAAREGEGSIGVTYALGIDAGSTSTDAAVLRRSGNGEVRVVAASVVPTGAKVTDVARRVREEVLAKAGLGGEALGVAVSTGYGRDAIPGMDARVTEITCHARGTHFLAPGTQTVIDIGGQDSKVIALGEGGSVANFVMNDKCAAGTGRFMEAMARALGMPLDEFCRMGLGWKDEVRISSMCTVFAESEVVSLVAKDTPTPDIIHGLCVSVARKTRGLVKRAGARGPYLMTGGVARNEGVVEALGQALGEPVRTHGSSQLCGAIGAALIGLEQVVG